MSMSCAHVHDDGDDDSSMADELREVCCSSDTTVVAGSGSSWAQRGVCCAAVCDDVLVWCTTVGEVYAWGATSGAQPQCVASTLGFVPTQLAMATHASQWRRVVFAAPDRVVVCTLCAHEDDSDDSDDAGDDAGDARASSSWSLTVCHEERYSSSSSSSSHGALSSVTHLSVSPDGGLAAMSTPTQLVLAWPSREDEDVVTSSHNAVMAVDCATWFGRSGGDGVGVGCARTCAAADDTLFVVSRHSHLLCLGVDRDTHTVALRRDGHVLTRVHTVCAMTATTTHDEGRLLLVALTDGAVLLLQADTLTAFSRLDTTSLLLQRRTSGRHARSSAAAAVVNNNSNEDAVVRRVRRVCDVAVGADALYIATCRAVLCVQRSSLTVDWARTQLLTEGDDDDDGSSSSSSDAADADVAMCCARNGCWAAWHVRGCEGDAASVSRVRYFVVAAAAARDRLLSGNNMNHHRNNNNSCCNDDAAIDCIHARQPLPASWLQPLQLPSSSSLSSPPAATAAAAARGAQRQRQPVTFGHRIRSSGYGAELPWAMQRARSTARQAKAKHAARCIGGGGAASTHTAATGATLPLPQCYRAALPYTAHPLRPLAARNRLLAREARVHGAAVLALALAPLADTLVSACHDGSLYAMRLPVAQHHGAGVLLRGADTTTIGNSNSGSGSGSALSTSCGRAVYSVDMSTSLQHPLVLTGGAGGVVQVWQPSRRGATPYITHTVTTTSTTATSTIAAPSRRRDDRYADKDVRVARFFYLDALIAYVCGGSLELCRYAVDQAPVDVLHRARNESCLSRPVFCYRDAHTHSLTAMECINHFTSNIVVVAGADRALHVVDVAAEAAAWCAEEAHARAIHHIAMCRASRFVDPHASPPSATRPCAGDVAHLFATAALDGVVRLWDVRTPHAVRQWSLHRNRALPSTGLALSPTAAMLAVGSEDEKVYVYDVASNATAPLSTLPCDGVPTALAWHPTQTELVAGLACGRVVFFAQQS